MEFVAASFYSSFVAIPVAIAVDLLSPVDTIPVDRPGWQLLGAITQLTVTGGLCLLLSGPENPRFAPWAVAAAAMVAYELSPKAKHALQMVNVDTLTTSFIAF